MPTKCQQPVNAIYVLFSNDREATTSEYEVNEGIIEVPETKVLQEATDIAEAGVGTNGETSGCSLLVMGCPFRHPILL
jgi:hypothetical protein